MSKTPLELWDIGRDAGRLSGRLSALRDITTLQQKILALPEAEGKPVNALIVALGGYDLEQARDMLLHIDDEDFTPTEQRQIKGTALEALKERKLFIENEMRDNEVQHGIKH